MSYCICLGATPPHLLVSAQALLEIPTAAWLACAGSGWGLLPPIARGPTVPLFTSLQSDRVSDPASLRRLRHA